MVTLKIKETIEKFQKSKRYKWFIWGEDYYNSDNTEIMCRRKLFHDGISDTQPFEHPFKANHKLPSGFLKKLVDQKVQYLLGNGVTITGEDKEQDVYKEVFSDNLDELVVDIGTTASKESKGWAKVVIEEGILRFVEVPPKQVIAFKDGFGEIFKLIRFFDTVDENLEEITKVEIWDRETVQVNIIKGDNIIETSEKRCHITTTTLANEGEVISLEEHSFGRVPFVEFENNKAMTSDLKPIKPFIDIYDIVDSDFANNIDDMQDAYFILKNFGGDSNELTEFMQQLKALKAVPVPEGSDVTAQQLVIPTEARSVFLELTDKNIFKYGMGVDTGNITGGSITNVVIKAMFADLDLKADQFEIQTRNFLNNITWFINWWLVNIRSQTIITPKFTFNRSLIVNEVELLEANSKQKGSVSEDTRLSNHPWVSNVEDEKKLIAEEQTERITRLEDPFELGD